MVSAASANPAQGTISEPEWARILGRIEGRTVIPVIGEYLCMVKGPGGEVPLATYLGARLGLPGPPPSSLNDLAVAYLKLHPRGMEDLYADIFQVLIASDSVPVPAPLRQLAEIRDFDLFVNTSFDPFMTMALNEVRFGRRSSRSTSVLSYERNREIDVPQAFRTLDYPIVYHLFGKAQAAPLFAVTDEDVLEFMHTLQAPDCQPPHLSEALRRERLLILGSRLTGWLTRFFLRVSAADRLRDARRADYLLVDPQIEADDDQALFFAYFGEVKLFPMPAVQFVAELSRRWKERHPEAVTSGGSVAPSLLPGAREVFLSYASEDLPTVKVLRERLEREAGVRVWLDKESLRGGDGWERRIADVLRSCAICVPVVSAHVKAGAYRYVRTEWREAVKIQSGRKADRPFILPLVLDDTAADDPALDADIRAHHWRRLPDEDDARRFIAEVRAAVEGPST